MQLKKVGLESSPFRNNEFASQNKSPTRKNNNNNVHKEEVIHSSEVKTVVSKLNDFMDPVQTNLQFKYHEELNEYYVTVINPLTNEVIKEIPPKKMLDMFASMVEFMGILIDEKI